MQYTLLYCIETKTYQLNVYQLNVLMYIIIIIIKAMILTWYKWKSTARPRYNTRG